MLVLVGLSVLLALLAVVIDLGRISLARKQLQSLADASALAAAGALQDQSVLFPGTARGRDIERFVDAPATRAGQRGLSFTEESLKVKVLADQATMPKGHIRTGCLSSQGKFVESENEYGCNAVEVKMGFTAARENALPLLVTRWFGQIADVEVVSVATVDQRLVGFAPSGDRRSPVAPLVLQESSESHGWYEQAAALTNGFNDRWSVADSVAPGEDGIPELVFRIPVTNSTANATAWRAQIGPSSADTWLHQMGAGLSADDLADHGGAIQLEQGAWQTRAAEASVSADAMVDAMRAIVGQPRVWPLGQAANGRVNITGFAAGQVVECWDEGDGWISVSIQPCTLTSDAALVSDDAPENPWIGKVVLSH
jgi:hypothetical protein